MANENTSKSGAAHASKSGNAEAHKGSKSGAAHASKSGNAEAQNEKKYVSPFKITYRKNLDRPLTSEEVDNNFAQIDKMNKILIETKEAVEKEIKTSVASFKDGMEKGTSELTTTLNILKKDFEDYKANNSTSLTSINKNISDISTLVGEVSSEFNVVFSNYVFKTDKGYTFNSKQFGEDLAPYVIAGLDEGEVTTIKSNLGITTLEKRTTNLETRLATAEATINTNTKDINAIKELIKPFAEADSKGNEVISVDLLAAALEKVFDNRYEMKKAPSASGSASATGGASSSAAASGSASGSANGNG